MPAVIDGRLVEDRNAGISISDDGLLRGDGVFEVLRLYGGVPWAFDEHLERMERSARGLRLEISASGFISDVAVLLDAVGTVDAFLRLVQTRGGRRISAIEALGDPQSSIALATIEYAPPALLDGVKSLSYAANMLAARLARERDADDALFVSPDGFVLEASRASFFYVLDGKLFTPPLDKCILDSITRRHLMEVVDVGERTTTRADLGDVVEAFIASTTKKPFQNEGLRSAILNPGVMSPRIGGRGGALSIRDH